jgi:hypothetical protein
MTFRNPFKARRFSAFSFLALAAFAALATECRAAGREFDDIRPLLGRWSAEKSCAAEKESVLVVFAENKASFSGEILDAAQPAKQLGRFDIAYNGSPGRYRIGLSLSDNPVLKLLKLDVLPGTLNVDDDPDDPDSPGKDYICVNANVGVLKSQVVIKLRSHKRKATFVFKDESPLGTDQCRGTAAKLKKPATPVK